MEGSRAFSLPDRAASYTKQHDQDAKKPSIKMVITIFL